MKLQAQTRKSISDSTLDQNVWKNPNALADEIGKMKIHFQYSMQ